MVARGMEEGGGRRGGTCINFLKKECQPVSELLSQCFWLNGGVI